MATLSRVSALRLIDAEGAPVERASAERSSEAVDGAALDAYSRAVSGAATKLSASVASLRLNGRHVSSAADLQTMMVAELIGQPTSARMVRDGSVLALTIVPAELEL